MCPLNIFRNFIKFKDFIFLGRFDISTHISTVIASDSHERFSFSFFFFGTLLTANRRPSTLGPVIGGGDTREKLCSDSRPFIVPKIAPERARFFIYVSFTFPSSPFSLTLSHFHRLSVNPFNGSPDPQSLLILLFSFLIILTTTQTRSLCTVPPPELKYFLDFSI